VSEVLIEDEDNQGFFPCGIFCELLIKPEDRFEAYKDKIKSI